LSWTGPDSSAPSKTTVTSTRRCATRAPSAVTSRCRWECNGEVGHAVFVTL
jgi:hypothetical protein